MKRFTYIAAFTLLPVAFLARTVQAQSFGLPLMKSKTVLQRKLPALVQLPGNSVRIVVSGHSDSGDLALDFRTTLGSELLKEDPRLRIEETGADSTIDCLIIAFQHPKPTSSVRPGTPTGKGVTPSVTYTRVTGLMRVSFRARGRAGQTIGSDNIVSKYDEEFDTAGNTVSGGVKGVFTNGVKRIKGVKSEDINPPTDAELRSRLLDGAVRQIVVQVVNTRETIEVQLAKGKGLDQGVKDAEAGLWSRALEEWGAAPAMPRPIDDAYRLYDLGVAYEAQAYAADDGKTAMKLLEEASVNYGNAIDSNPAEKYFRQPQKRIETALAHYEKLEAQSKAPPPPPSGAPRTKPKTPATKSVKTTKPPTD